VVGRGRPPLLAGRLLGRPRCRRRAADAQRKAPARDLRWSCSFAAALRNRRLRPGTRWLAAVAGRARRSVPAGRSRCWARESLRPNANARALRYAQPREEGDGVTEAAEEGSGGRQDGQDEEAEAEEENLAREVTAAEGDRAPSPVSGGAGLRGPDALTQRRRAAGLSLLTAGGFVSGRAVSEFPARRGA